MPSRIIILVSDRDDEKHGEISVLDDLKKAQHLVETLIEAGFEQERIRAFSGGELEIQVTQRPVVSLVKNEGQGEERAVTEEAEAEPGSADEEETSGGMRFSSLFRSG